MGVAVAALVLLAVPASAHAGVIAAEPAGGISPTGPTTVHLRFSEPVTPIGRGIAVWAPAGRQVGMGLMRPSPSELAVKVDAGPRGTYLVVWTVIASDTHPSRGSYTFSVGVSTTVPDVGGLPAGDVGAVSPLGLLLQVAGRWIHLAGYALAFGSVAFAMLVLRLGSEPRAEEACQRLALLGIVMLVVAEPLMLLAQVLSLGGLDGQVFADVLASASGRLLALRLGAAVLLWALLGAAHARRREAWAAALVLGLALGFIDGAASHVVKDVPLVLGLLLNASHEVAMGAWLGGLAALVTVLAAVPSSARMDLTARFGRFAAGSVTVLVVSGALLALAHLRSPADLISSTYGTVVLIKVAGVGAALVAAYLGLRAGRPWRIEAVALAGVLALAGLLVSLPPLR